MTSDARQPEGIGRPRSPYSHALVSGDLVYTAGQVTFDEDGAIVPDVPGAGVELHPPELRRHR
nr:hypothetical protein [Chloroflexota bacterium]